jgi:hypothetical protein
MMIRDRSSLSGLLALRLLAASSWATFNLFEVARVRRRLKIESKQEGRSKALSRDGAPVSSPSHFVTLPKESHRPDYLWPTSCFGFFGMVPPTM